MPDCQSKSAGSIEADQLPSACCERRYQRSVPAGEVMPTDTNVTPDGQLTPLARATMDPEEAS